MTITYTERFQSPNSINEANNKRDDQWTKNYLVHGDAAEDELQITNYLASNLPQTIGDLILQKLKVSREEADEDWSCDVTYSAPANPKNRILLNPGGGYRWTVRSSGGASVPRQFSNAFVGESVSPLAQDKWALATKPNEVKKIIGWRLTSEGATTTEPIDFPVGGVEIGVELAVTAAEVTQGLLVTIASHAALQAVNAVAWNGFAAQTLRFTNFSAIPRNGLSPAWDVSYTFDYSPNQTVTMDQITITKAGQHYLEICTELYEIAGAQGLMLPTAVRLATHKMRPEINYTTELKI
jgi:hypothetical protein